MQYCNSESAMAASKWDAYYASCDLSTRLPPWDSGRPCSQLQALVSGEPKCDDAGTIGKGRRTALDLGCGSGASACFLASRGWAATGVDICEKAIALARQRWEEESVAIESARCEDGSSDGGSNGGVVGPSTGGGEHDADSARERAAQGGGGGGGGGRRPAANAIIAPKFDCADFTVWCRQRLGDDTPPNDTTDDHAADESPKERHQFDLVFDCQFFHAVWHPKGGGGGDGGGGGGGDIGIDDEGRRLARCIARCVAPGGKLLLLTGNADDPRGDLGPTRLTPQHILGCFLSASSPSTAAFASSSSSSSSVHLLLICSSLVSSSLARLPARPTPRSLA